MPWLAKVPTVLIAWYAGQQDGAALARVLAGDVDPGGRLPVTFGRRESDYPARSPERYPGVDFVENYGEGAFIGYRHFDALEIEPMFCFGHGLSYTSFSYERPAGHEAAAPQRNRDTRAGHRDKHRGPRRRRGRRSSISGNPPTVRRRQRGYCEGSPGSICGPGNGRFSR